MRNIIIVVVCLGLGMATLPLFLHGPLSQANNAKSKKDGESRDKKKIVPRATFPDELAPLADGLSVAKAAEWKKSQTPIMVVLDRSSGKLHRWHEYLKEQWRSYSVENTELALVVSKQWKQYINTIYFKPSNAPPVKRYSYHLDVWLLEAKTGESVASQRFTNHPRQINEREPWKLTTLGEQVRWKAVRTWLEAVVNDRAEQSPSIQAKTEN